MLTIDQVDSKSVTACNDSLNSRTSNVNAVCATCGKCVFSSNHDACVSKFLKDVNARTKKPNVVWYGYQENDKNKDKTRQKRAREWNESEKTSPTLLKCIRVTSLPDGSIFGAAAGERCSDFYGIVRVRDLKILSSERSLNDKILVSESDSSPCCARCGTPVDGPSCRGCAFLRKKFDEDLLAYCVENGIFKDFQDTFEPSDDNTNVVNALREPCVVNQDPGVKKGAHYGYNCPPKVSIISNPEQCNQTINELPQILPIVHPTCNYETENSFAYVPNPNSFDNSPNFSYPPPQLQFETYLCELCRNNAHYGYDCSPQFPFVYEQESCYNQNFNDNYYPQNSPSFSQQYLCCAYCGGPHHDYQCQPINETCYEPNPSYDYSGFDHPQPPQDSVYCQEALDKILKELEELKRDQRMLKELKKKIAEEQTGYRNMSIEEMRHEQQLVDRKIKEITNDLGIRRFRGEEIDEEYERDCEIRIRKLKQDFNIWGSEVRKKEKAYEDEKYAAACRYMLSVTCDDEDDYIPLAITPDLPIEEPDNSLNMGDEHLDTIPATESDEVIKSSVENLVPIPSEFEGISDDSCDVPICDIGRINVESDFVESLINRDTSIDYSSKIDPILEEFADELAHIAPIPPGIVEADPNDDTSSDDDDFEDIEYVSLEEENDVDQEEKEFNLEDIFQIQDKLLNVHRLISNIESLKVNSTLDRVLESPSPFPIPVVDSDAFFEESDTSLSHSDNSLPEFESFSDQTEETRSGSTTTHANYSLPEFESFHFDPSFPRPPPEPPDVEILEPENNNFDVLNNDESFDPREGENVVFLNVEEDDSFTFTIRTFLPFLTYPRGFTEFEDSRALWYGYQENDKNKDKVGQNRARDRKERENTSPTQLVDREIKGIINDLGYKRFEDENIDEEYEKELRLQFINLSKILIYGEAKFQKKEKLRDESKMSCLSYTCFSVTCDDEDDYIPLAITIDLPIEEPDNSLKIGDESQLDTNPQQNRRSHKF
ncbi:hypothetical protein Tco_0117279 [Tanacetum coccineum]